MSRFHLFPPDRVHRTWNRENEPVLEVEPGDTVFYETRDATNNQVTKDSTSEDLDALDWDTFYPLAGPLYVRGAEPGDALVVDILEVQHRGWGWTGILPGLGVLQEEFPEPHIRIWETHDGKYAYMNDFVRVPIDPFAGTMGVVAAVQGELEPMPPRHVGGNMDCRHLTAGTTLYLPVEVKGGLFSLGDGHLAQGDGEVCVSAIEGDLGISCRFDVIKNQPLSAPEIETPPGPLTPFGDQEGYFATMGVADDLMVATRDAVRSMVGRIGDMYGLSPEDAYMLASVAADLKITEVVDPNWIVTLYMPRAAFLREPHGRNRLSMSQQ